VADDSRGPSTGAEAHDGGGGPDRVGPVLISVQEIVDYVECPLFYAFKRGLEITPEYTVHSLWAYTLGAHYIKIHAVYSEGKPLSWAKVLDSWDTGWGLVCKANNVSHAEGQSLRGRGARHLKEVFDELDSVSVLGYQYPSERRFDNHLVTGHIDVIRALEDKDKGKSGRTIQIIFVDYLSTHVPSTTEANRRLDYVLALYGLSLDIRNKYRKLAAKVKTMVYLARLPKLIEYKVDEFGVRHAARWVGDVLRSIEQKIFYPRASQRCAYCSYKVFCDVSNARS